MKSPGSPRVSVLMPVFNARPYLSDALESIRTQTMRDFELLLFDDGSSDGSLEESRQAAKDDPRIICVEGEHRGYAHWLNAGIEMAKGAFIARMDADDVASPERFDRQLQYLDANQDCCAVGAGAIRMDPEGLPISRWRVPHEHAAIDARHMEGRPGGIVHPTLMMRTSLARKLNGYRVEFEPAEDYDLFLRLAEAGRLANLDACLLHYRVHPKGVSLARAEAQSKAATRALAEAWTRRNKPGSSPVVLGDHRVQPIEELIWSWAKIAFFAGYFDTAMKHAVASARKSPRKWKRWVFLAAACLASTASRTARMAKRTLSPSGNRK